MALTFTVAAMQTQLSTYGEAMALATAAGYVTARAALRKARAIRMGLPDTKPSQGENTEYPSLQWFEAALKEIDAAEDAITGTSSSNSQKRLIRTGLTHHG